MSREVFNESILDNSNHATHAEALSPDQYESLAVLQSSPHWKVYREILHQAKQSYLDSILAMREPIDITKHLGIAAGINFALNQLPLLVAGYTQAAAKRLETLEQGSDTHTNIKRG